MKATVGPELDDSGLSAVGTPMALYPSIAEDDVIGDDDDVTWLASTTERLGSRLRLELLCMEQQDFRLLPVKLPT